MLQDAIVKNLAVETLQAATDVGAVDTVWVDAGNPIRMGLDTRLIIYYDLVVEDSTGIEIRFLPCKTAAGAPYPAYNPAMDTWALGATDENRWIEFDAEAFLWVQVQTRAAVVNSAGPGGTIGTIAIDYTRVRV